MFKIKGGYKLQLQTPETMRLFCSTKKSRDKTKKGENLPSLEVAEVFLGQFNLVGNNINKSLRCYILLASNKILRLSVKCWTEQFGVFQNL